MRSGEIELGSQGLPQALESKEDPAELHKEGWRPVGWVGGGDTLSHCTQGPKESQEERGAPGLACAREISVEPGLWGMGCCGDENGEMLLNLGEVE